MISASADEGCTRDLHPVKHGVTFANSFREVEISFDDRVLQKNIRTVQHYVAFYSSQRNLSRRRDEPGNHQIHDSG
ncbi:hypothetical protein D3C72_2515590 [compost metagenome]